MTDPGRVQHHFRVCARHLERHHARILHEASFEAAAVAYLEHLAPAPGEEGEISVVVCDLESGHEHCFRLDLVSDATASGE